MATKMKYSTCKSTTLLFLILAVYLFLGVHSILPAQDWARTNIKDLQRVDLRDLGYPLVNEIPENSSAVTSLLTARDGIIYGGTTGEVSYLFMFDPEINKIRHLGRIPDQESIHHSLVEDKDGKIYLGTGMNMFREINLSKGGLGAEGTIDKSLWEDIKNHFKDYSGGHLYRYNPASGNQKVKLPDMSCEIEDLGIPLAHNSIYALTINPEGNEIYGITYPDGHFFVYLIASKRFTDLGPVDDKIVFHGPERY